MVDETLPTHEPLHVLPVSPGIALGLVRLLDQPEEPRVQQSTRAHIQVEQLASERQLLQQTLTLAEVEVKVGIMIETPAAVWLADVLAREVDFFSIGANDLFQHTLAADRTNSRVMGLFGGLEPALWRSINHVLQAARIYPRIAQRDVITSKRT
jgi:phosphoenolpyruvate-protein kinase (PTS system EI component)